MRVLIVDNYDSFTYNVVQALGALGAEPEVVRPGTASLAALRARRPDGLVVSAGPGRPENARLSVQAVRALGEEGIPVLGVCLGHQAIGAAFGASIVRAGRPMHGKTSPIRHDGKGLFRGIPSPFDATRYHSLVLDPRRCRAPLGVCAMSPDGEVMAVRHRQLPIEGVQFHPESILTREGPRMLANFLDHCRGEVP